MEFEHAKLFVGGISQETSDETLKEHFGKYGEVIDSEIIRDRSTGKARGFCFVTFADLSAVDKALQDVHIILGRKVEVKLAKPKDERSQISSSNCNGNFNILLSNKKIFVGGLPPSLTEEEFKKYFERFGVITDVVVICDKENNRSRGFGFITFDSEKAVDHVLQNNYHKLNDKLVEVKRAESKDRHIYTYDCYDTGLGLERLSVSGDCRLHLPYIAFSTTCSACMSVLGYFYGAVFPTRPCNGVAYNTFSDVSYPLSYGNHFFYTTYMNGGGYTNGLGSRLVGMRDGNGSYHGSATFVVNSNSTDAEISASSGPVGVTDGTASYHGNATFVVNSNSTDAEVAAAGEPV